MSQTIRRFLAAIITAVVLLLAVPAPSQAARARKPVASPSLGLLEQAWSWLQSRLGDPRGLEVRRKDGTTTPPTNPLQPPAPPTQGPMIDPDGTKG